MRLGARIFASVLLLSMYLPIAVVSAVSNAITISGLNSTETAGAADNTVKVTASVAGVPDPTYVGTVHFSSTDSGGSTSLPGDYTFTGADAGVHTFSVTFTSAGSQSLTVLDDGSLTDTANTTVLAAAAATVVMSGTMTSLASGSARLATATVTDAFGNPIVDQSVVFTEAGGGGSVSGLTPANTDSTGVATDNVIGLVAGPVVITGTVGSASNTLSFSVVQGPVTSISVTPSSSSIAPGGSQSYATTSSDAAGNTAVVTGTAALSIGPNGSCDTMSCTATIGGAHTVTSSFSGHTDTSTLTVGNNPPTAVTDARTVLENAVSTLFDVLTNDTDPDGDTLTVTAVSNPAHGTATFAAANVHYQPDANFSGADSFTYSISDGNGGTDTGTVNVTITGVNVAPSFIKGANQSVSENAGAQSLSNWVVAKSPGPGNFDVGQTLNFIVSNDNNSLFSSQPAVAANGTLTYTPVPNKSGSATVMISIHDNGGTANGGSDTSATQTMTITVNGVNQAPSFTGGPDETLLEDAGAQTHSAWATNISEGAGDTGQVLNFVVTNNNNALFSVQPSLDPASGDLTYTPAPNANGTALVTVTLHDNGGTANSGVDTSASQTMIVNVTAVNDPPTFTDPPPQIILEDAGAQTVVGLVAPVSPGPANEAAQTLTFLVTNTNNALFSVQPSLNATTGTLTYTPALDANGTALVTANLSDNGGVLNGGLDHSSHQFNITITSVNDAPTFTSGANVSLPEESSPSSHTIPGWANNFVPGPANEVSQTLLGYTVTNDHTALFSVQPTISNSGNLTYTLAANRNGVANVRVTARDSGGTANGGVDTSVVHTFTIKVVGVDHPPAAINDFPTVVQGSGPVLIDVLANDSDPDGDPLTIAGFRQGTNGKVAITADHKFLTYDPNGSFVGTDSFIYSISDGRGGLAVGTVLVTVVKDTFAPVATAPTAWIMALPVGTTATIALTWSGTDQGFGVKYYILQESKNNAAWVNVPVPIGVASAHRVVAINSSYQYRVRAVDLAGNGGGWAYLPNFKAVLYQETAATYLGTWKSVTLAGALGGSVKYATTHGSVASFTCTCSSISWIGPKGPTRSTARVYLDGVMIGTYTEHNTTTLAAQGIYARTWGTVGVHRIDISVTGAGRVDVDGFLTLQ